jgi:tight adherence protein B
MRKEEKLGVQLDNLFYEKSPRKIINLYFILPPLGAIVGIFMQSIFISIGGALFGLFIPNFLLRIREAQRRYKFNAQILDMIMILSSSLKGGLSLLQALEVVVEEMPAPMSQEIGLLVRENKMGVSLEDCLKHFNKRMNMEDLSLVINSIMVARETGGDLTKVLSRLSTTIRDNRKLKDSIKTLTLQGRMQGMIMSALPFLFIWWVITFNRQHFDVMIQTEQGRTLLFVAAGLQVVGMVLIKKFSEIKV